LILADVFVALLVTKGVRWAIRSRRGHTAPRPPSSGLWPVGAHDGRGT
jgi:hypothetical protein